MVGLLIRMKLAVLRHSMSGKRSEDMISGGSVGLLLAAGTIALALLHFAQADTAFSVMILAFTTWTVGWMIGPAMFGGGDETLRPEQFALLPLDTRRLAAGLLGASFVGVAPAISLLAFAALIVLAVPFGAAATAVAVVATPLHLIFVVLLSRVSTALLNQVMRTRTGSGLSALVSGAIMALSGSGWALAPLIGFALTSGFPPGLATTIRVLPTGWSVAAVEAAADGRWLPVAGFLAGLVVLCGLLLLSWAAFLVRRMTTRPAEAGTASRFSPVKPSGPVTAVLSKELLAWSRDLRRFHFYVFALAYAVLFCLLPVAVGSTDFLPWTGIMFAAMAAAMSSGLYSEDGTGLWTALLTPGASAPDVRGRQLGWLAVVAPVALALTAALTFATGHDEQWPMLLAVLLSVLGSSAGFIVLMSLLRLVPIADPQVRSGNMMENPTDFVQSLLTLALVAGSALPAFLVARQEPWAGPPVGLAVGAALAVGLGWLAHRRLDARGPELLQLMRSGPPKQSAKRKAVPEALKPELGWRAAGMFCLTVCWIPLFPQGIVPAVMLLTDSVTTSWFLALHVERQWAWPVIVTMVTMGLVLLTSGVLIMRKHKPAT